jgi:CBS domain-containing protein
MKTHASQVMVREVVCVTPETPVREALALMLTDSIRHLLVTSGKRLVGVVSDRDIADPATHSKVIEAVMTTPPITCAPDTSVGRLAELMVANTIDSVPILRGEKLVGIVTSTDLLRLLIDRDSKVESVIPFDFLFRELGAAAIAINAERHYGLTEYTRT